MIVRILILCTFFLLSINSFSQSFEKVYEHTEKQPFFQLLEKEEAEYYLSGNGHYLISNTSEAFALISGTTGEQLAGGRHLKKSNKSAKLASLFVADHRKSQLIEDVSFNEGAGFYAFEDEGVVLFLDWTLDQNVLKAFHAETGEKLWEKEEYRYSPGKNKQLAAILATIAVGKVADQTFSLSNMMAEGVFRSFKNQQTRSYGSQTARAFITPLEGTGSFLLKAGKQHVCLDIQTGEEKWVYDDYPVNIAWHGMVPGKKEVVLVNFNPSYWKKSENLIFNLNTETGEEKYRIENLNNYVEDRTYIEGDRLVLDYYGAEVYDLHSGEQVLLTIDERIVKANKALMSIIGEDGQRQTTALSIPSWIENGILYTGIEERGGRVYPILGSSRNPQFTAYELQTGNELWLTPEHQRGSNIIGINERDLILESHKGLNKIYLVSVDKRKGETRHETDKMKRYLFRDNAGYIVGEEKILSSTKDGILLFNEENLAHEKTLDVKAADIGKAQAFGLRPGGFFVVADKGVGFYDERGEYTSTIRVKKVQSALWNEQLLVVMNKETLVAIDLNQRKAAVPLPLTETALSSYNLKHWLFHEGNKTAKFTLRE